MWCVGAAGFGEDYKIGYCVREGSSGIGFDCVFRATNIVNDGY